MRINFLKLENFRNYKSREFAFSQGLNIVSGANAVGKTNLAEAVFYLCTGYSPRANKDKQLVTYGESRARITGKAENLYGTTEVEMTISDAEKKQIKINGMPINRIGELFGNINSVFFNPGELKLIQESPEDRRRFLDISLSQMNKGYFYALQRYNKILTQRNNLLKDRSGLVYETLPIWDEQLCENAGKIIKQRNEFLKVLSPIAREIHAYLSDNKEILETSAELKYDGDEKEIAEELKKRLTAVMEKDLYLGFTTIGPHRDDIKITLGGKDIKIFGSQGQQRTASLSIKLAEAEIFKNRFGEYPILILDDVMSELERKRQRLLLKRIENMQVILTCTHIESGIIKGVEHNDIKLKNIIEKN